MKIICQTCSPRIMSHGYQHYYLCHLVAESYLRGIALVFDEFLSPSAHVIAPCLKTLENLGYLVSCEVSTSSIAIIPNLRTSILLQSMAAQPGDYCQICWCRLTKK